MLSQDVIVIENFNTLGLAELTIRHESDKQEMSLANAFSALLGPNVDARDLCAHYESVKNQLSEISS